MVSTVQQDVTDEDVQYFAERGFFQNLPDLNTLTKDAKRGATDEMFRIVGRPHGWQWSRLLWDSEASRVLRSHTSPTWHNDPITCFVSAEIAGWKHGDAD